MSSAKSIQYVRTIAKAGRSMSSVLTQLLDSGALSPEQSAVATAAVEGFRKADADVPMAQRPGLNTLERFRMRSAVIRKSGVTGLELERQIRSELFKSGREPGADSTFFPVSAIRELPSVSTETLDQLLIQTPGFWPKPSIWATCVAHVGSAYDVSTRFAHWVKSLGQAFGGNQSWQVRSAIQDILPGKVFDRADPLLLDTVTRGLRPNATGADLAYTTLFSSTLLSWRHLPYEILLSMAEQWGHLQLSAEAIAAHPRADDKVWTKLLDNEFARVDHFLKAPRAFRNPAIAASIIQKWPKAQKILLNGVVWGGPTTSVAAFRALAEIDMNVAAEALAKIPKKTLRAGYTTDELALVTSATSAKGRTAAFFAIPNVRDPAPEPKPDKAVSAVRKAN